MVAIIMDIVTILKQQLPVTRATGSLPYACQACCARFDAQRQVCPTCGSYTIERTDWPCLE
jgi:rRNA maturation endonuclease Nob1